MTRLRWTRISEWWEYKLPPLLAILPGAAYVSLINDLADLRTDAACGKPNRMSGFSGLQRASLVLACLSAGLTAATLLPVSGLTLFFYAGAWLAFTLYSLPPFRLKARGPWGVVADASGAHLFPTLFVVSGCLDASTSAPIPGWLAAAGCWSFLLGVRGILCHQFLDRDNDRRSGIRTFATKLDPQRFAPLTFLMLLPELAALGWMLWGVGSWLPPLALLAYGFLLVGYGFVLRYAVVPAIAPPGRPAHIIGHNFYLLLLPASLVLAAATADPRLLWLIAAHLFLFPNVARQTFTDLRLMAARIGLRLT